MTVTNSNGSVVKGPLETYQLAGVLSAWKQRQSVREALTHLNNNLPQNEATLTLGNTTSQTPLQLNGLSFSLKLGILKRQATITDFGNGNSINGRVYKREVPKRIRGTY